MAANYHLRGWHPMSEAPAYRMIEVRTKPSQDGEERIFVVVWNTRQQQWQDRNCTPINALEWRPL